MNRPVIICADDEPDVLNAIVRDIRSICGDKIDVEGCITPSELFDVAERARADQRHVPIFLVDYALHGMNGGDLLLQLQEDTYYRKSMKLILSARATSDDLTRILNRGALNGNLRKPWKLQDLTRTIRFLLTEYTIHNAPELIEDLTELLDVEMLSHALVDSEMRVKDLGQKMKKLQRSFLEDLGKPDREVEDGMIAHLDEALGYPDRQQLERGAVFLREGDEVDGIWIILEGRVSLFRIIEGREVIFHSQTSGRIIGLLALATRRRSFFHARAATPITMLKISTRDLDKALQRDPQLPVSFISVLMRSMAARNRRAVELQMEVLSLNETLAREKDNLDQALRDLKQTQTLLVETEKMATLGQMSAGIAHELNNPVAAICRSAEYIRQDLVTLMSSVPACTWIGDMIEESIRRKPVSTREQRQLRSELANAIGDEQLAQRLVQAGISDKATFDGILARLPRDEQDHGIDCIERCSQIGSAIRNVNSCAERIAGLVKSLRSYIRSDETRVHDIDVHEGIEDTLLLFSNKLRDITVDRDYNDVPRIEGNPGELNQVWTNLISNAIQAMNGRGTLTVSTGALDGNRIMVAIQDSGPGIPPEHIDRIFDVKFTTRQGRVEFGLGLGLPICRNIVTRHHGTIHAESKPGQTRFVVTLPIHSPEESATEEQTGAAT